ncbi:MAG: DHH family phosphoesterase [archaeon]
MIKKAKEISLKLKEWDDIVIVSHTDADGLCAAAIMQKSLERIGKTVKVKFIKQLYSDTFQEIKILGKKFVFTDFGSGQLKQLIQEFGTNFIVLDHHEPLEIDYPLHLNPGLYGLNGSNEVSGAGVTFFAARELGDNKDLTFLAVLGAFGDMMDTKTSQLESINSELLKEAIKLKQITEKTDIKLYGRLSRPLTQFISLASDPFLPGLTANEEASKNLLLSLGINLKEKEKWKTYNDLTVKEKQDLVSWLLVLLSQKGFPGSMNRLIGKVFELNFEPQNSILKDVKEFTTALNATARNGKPELGLRLCLGDRGEVYEQVVSMLALHRRNLREGIEFVKEHGVKEFSNFYYFDAESIVNERIVGIIAGMLYSSGLINNDKPVIAVCDIEDNQIKISARANWQLVKNGLHLGKSLRKVFSSMSSDCEGGGHSIAAGGRLPRTSLKEFLEKLDENLKK